MRDRTIERVQTPRMMLERLRPEHEGELRQVMLDPRVVRWLSPTPEAPTPPNVAASLEARIEHWRRYGFGLWLLRDRATGEPIGRGGLQWTFVAGLNDVEVGWTVVPERWGEGLATEMASAAIEVARNELRLESIVAFTRPDNVASRRVMEKTGFVYEREITHLSVAHVLYRRQLIEIPPA
jgi:[ribosomal protein S5]-alanine N-acetyltransferase